jgi:hypothetical protein
MTGPLPWIRGRRREDAWVEAEVVVIERVLRERGPLDVRELRAATESRFWGPGRFSAALDRARRTGRVRRTGRRRYAAAE